MRFQFADFTADLDTRQLIRVGAEIHISPKAFDLLVTLIRARPRVQSKAELHAGLWPKTFVSDASLAMLVAELRAALADDAKRPRFLRTVHRHGYAFSGSATELGDTGRSTATSSTGYWLVTEQRQVPLGAPENIVGRDPQVQVWIDSPSISRRHARISIADGSAVLEDLQSKNGTHVHGRSIAEPVTLSDGDEILFGSVAMTFRVWTSDVSTR